MRDTTNRQTFLPPKYLDMNTIYSVGNPEREETEVVFHDGSEQLL